MTLRTLNYGNYGIFLTMGNAGFCPSAVRSEGLNFVCEYPSLAASANGQTTKLKHVNPVGERSTPER